MSAKHLARRGGLIDSPKRNWTPSQPRIQHRLPAPVPQEPFKVPLTRVHVSVAIVLIMLLASMSAFNFGHGTISASIDYNVHSPIVIDSNADFAAQALVEGWPGDGSPSSPYQIRDLEIAAMSLQNAIYIGNVTVNFTIDSCHLVFATNGGIALFNTSSGVVIGNVCEGNTYGILLYGGCSNNSLVNNTCSSNGLDGIHVTNAYRTAILNNTCDSNTVEGISIGTSTWMWITSNSCDRNSDGIRISGCQFFAMNYSECLSNNYAGIWVDNSQFALIGYSTCNDNSEGIELDACSQMDITDNSCSGNYDGMYLTGCANLGINGGNMSLNTVGMYMEYSDGPGIRGLDASNNYYDGVYLFSCVNLSFENCRFAMNGMYGIEAESVGWWIHGCDLSNDSVAGLYGYDVRGEIMNNTCADMTTGMEIDYSTYCNVTSNRFIRCYEGLYLVYDSGMNIMSNRFTNCTGPGMEAYGGDSLNITGNFCSNDGAGMVMSYVSNSILRWNMIQDTAGPGISLDSSSTVRLTENGISRTDGAGIQLSYSDGNMIDNNSLAATEGFGTLLQFSNSNVVENNSFDHDLQAGLNIYYSMSELVKDNKFVHCGAYIAGDNPLYWNTHNITRSNTVNMKPLVYLANQVSVPVPGGAGQVLLASCGQISVAWQDLSWATVGVEAGFCIDISIANVTCSSDAASGIEVWYTDTVWLADNICTNDGVGILGYSSQSLTLHNDMCQASGIGAQLYGTNDISVDQGSYSNDGVGVSIQACTATTVSNVMCMADGEGVVIGYSPSTEVNFCSFTGDTIAGIHMSEVEGVHLRMNTFSNCGIVLEGSVLSQWTTHSIDTTNVVNGKPVVYVTNVTSWTAPSSAGQIIVANSTSVSVDKVVLDGASWGLEVGYCGMVFVTSSKLSNNSGYGLYMDSTSGAIVWNCTMTDNRDGALLGGSSSTVYFYNNTVSRNSAVGLTVSSSGIQVHDNLFLENGGYGAWLTPSSSGVQVWNNTFAYNNGTGASFDPSRRQASDDGSGNTWFVAGSPHGWGNYWHDWATHGDANLDGIVDIPYGLDGYAMNYDLYPLAAPLQVIPEFGVLLPGLVSMLGIAFVVAFRRRREQH